MGVSKYEIQGFSTSFSRILAKEVKSKQAELEKKIKTPERFCCE